MARDGDGVAILRKVVSTMPKASPWRDRIHEALLGRNHIGLHLAVFVGPYLEAILDGRKTIESRFGVHRCAPFHRVRAGDIILLKHSGGPIVGIAVAGETAYYELDPGILDYIRERFAAQILAEDDEFWVAREGKRFATLIEIDDVTKIDTLSIQKRDRRGWITYKEGRQPCLALAS